MANRHEALASWGSGCVILRETSSNDFAIARLLPNGSLDPDFGGDGRVTVAFDLADTLEDTALELNLADDGSIFVSGGVKASGYDFAVVKLQPDGTPDPTFGTGGKVTVAFDLGDTNDDIAYGGALQPDGKFVFSGFAGAPTPDIALARLDVDAEDQDTFARSLRQLDELFLLVVVGEFNAGKSAFINALLGQRLLGAASPT